MESNMDDSACVVFTDDREYSLAIDSHWHCRLESVSAFVDAPAPYRTLGNLGHGTAVFTHLVGNLLSGGSCSIRMPKGDSHEA